MNSLSMFFFVKKILGCIYITLMFTFETPPYWQEKCFLSLQMILLCAFGFRYCSQSAISLSFIAILLHRTVSLFLTIWNPFSPIICANYLFDDFNIHHFKWINHPNVTDIVCIQTFNSSVV